MKPTQAREITELVKPPNPIWKKYLTDISSIIIDLSNLSEQYFILGLSKSFDVGDTQERSFYSALTVIFAAQLISKMFKNARIGIILMALAEIGELISYLIIFNGTLYNGANTPTYPFVGVTCSCLLVQLILYSCRYYLTEPFVSMKTTFFSRHFQRIDSTVPIGVILLIGGTTKGETAESEILGF